MPLAINELTELVIKSAIAVHDALGPGLLESVYVECLLIELRSSGLSCEAGLLFNFNATSIRQGLKRLDHPDIYRQNHPGRRQ